MRILRRQLLAVFAAAALPLPAQEAGAGFTMPVVVTGGAMQTHRLKTEDADAATVAAGFRATLYPTLNLGPHWFAYSHVQLRAAPFFYYDAYEPERAFKADLIQAAVGYSRAVGKAVVTIKGGRLLSAFGSFPPRYGDETNPLLDQPLSYISDLKLRPDQLPCGVNDLLDQRDYGRNVQFACGGGRRDSDGMLPVTLYGLTGIEADLSINRFDARAQLTSSSPANPQSLLSRSQSAQWTAGGGYTFRNGLRVGVSGFRGPYLDRDVQAFLPMGTTLRNYPAAAFGADVQWARGRWSLTGEWQRFRFSYPGFRTPPIVAFGYAEVKAILSPRVYLAGRAGYQRHGRVEDLTERSDRGFAPDRQAYEFAIGYRPNRLQLVKVGYEWTRTNDVRGMLDNVLDLQLVTTLPTPSRALR